MRRIVPIKNMGHVAFPDHMSDQEVQSAAQKLHQQANPMGIEDVIQALVKQEPGPSSKTHQKMSEVAQVLEQNPALLQLAIAGLSAPAPAGQQPQEQQQSPASPQEQQGEQSSQQPPSANVAA